MLNLVYHETIDEDVYAVLSQRMRDRYDILGTLPDVIEDDWIGNIEHLEEKLRDFTNRRRQANAFDLRYAVDVEPTDERWELFERVLARNDVIARLSKGWGKSDRSSFERYEV